jgi:hypothetical protein
VSRGEGSGLGAHAISLSDTLYPFCRTEAGEDAAVVYNKSTSTQEGLGDDQVFSLSHRNKQNGLFSLRPQPFSKLPYTIVLH